MILLGLPVTYQKTKLQSFIVTSENFSTALQPLEQRLNMEFEIQLNEKENITEGQIQYLKDNTIS